MAAPKKNARQKKTRCTAPRRATADRPEGHLPPKFQKKVAGPSSAKREPAIDEYLAKVSPRSRALLRELRATIHSLVPEVEECISYRLPALRYQGRIIAGFSATSDGCSYYPFSATTLKTLAGDIQGYNQTKGALHFGREKTAGSTGPRPTTSWILSRSREVVPCP